MPAPSSVRNLADLVRRGAFMRPDAHAVISDDRRITWRELDQMIEATASGLLRHGLLPGDRVALVLSNVPEFVVTYFAALRAQLVVVPINTGYGPDELGDVLHQAAPALVVAEAGTVAAVMACAGATPILVVGEPSYDALLRAGQRADATAVPPTGDFNPESLALVMFTPGVKGEPVGAMLTHRALLANISQLQSMPSPATKSGDVVLVVLPLYHVYALGAVLGTAAAVGATCVLVERFDPVETLQTIVANKVTNLPGTPPMYLAWSRLPGAAAALAGVETLVSGAAALGPSLLAQLTEFTGRPVWEGYGMTEASPVVATTLVDRRPTPGSVGPPLPGVTVRLVDDQGDDAHEGDPGEILLRGDNLFSGYWPDGTGGPDEDGWWATGDVAYLDEHGGLHLVDRRRDVVMVSGFPVYPFEVETVICSHPEVAEAAVIGEPSDASGFTVKAYVVALTGEDLTAESVSVFCRTHLARFKCPTEVEIVAALPHTPSGKVVRALLRSDV